jgi:hypothetical protein
MERELLKILDFSGCFPTAQCFLLYYFQLASLIYPNLSPRLPIESSYRSPKDNYECGPIRNIEHIRVDLPKFVTASSALSSAVSDYECLKYCNSVLAASIFCLIFEKGISTYLTVKDLPSDFLLAITGFRKDQLSGAIGFMAKFNPEKILSVYDEYPIEPDGGLSFESYSKIFHQSHPTQTQEEMEQLWASW